MHFLGDSGSKIYNSYKGYKETSEPFIQLNVGIYPKIRDINSYGIKSRQMQKVLDAFDPMGTGYEYY